MLRRTFLTRRSVDLSWGRSHRSPRWRSEKLGLEALEVRALLAIDSGAALFSPCDVNQDGYVSAGDALLIIDTLNQPPGNSAPAAASLPELMTTTYDVNGDGLVDAADAEAVLGELDSEAVTTLFRIRLQVTDLDGNPITTSPTGGSFLLKGYVLDQRAEGNVGVFAAFADVTWDGALASATGPIDNSIYSTGASGTASSGLLDEIGGISGQFSPPLGPSEQLLFSVPFTAGATPGVLNFAADPADLISPGNPAHNSLLFNDPEHTIGGVPTTLIEYGAATVVVTTSDPVTVSIAPPAEPIVEGNAGATLAEFTVTLSAPSSHSLTVNFATQNGTALAPGDYSAANGTLTFAPGETVKKILVSVLGDTRDDADSETFSVVLSNPAEDPNWSIDQGTATAQIADDDPEPSISIADPADVTEGNLGTTAVIFVVTLSNPSDQTVTVDYTTVAGAALPGTDFTASSGTLTFAPGVTSLPITINVLGDTLDEPLEAFSVQLSNPTGGAALAKDTGTVKILDDDATPAVSAEDAEVAEPSEGTTTLTFTVKLAQASEQQITVDYETIAGTATSPGDFAAASGSLVFEPGVIEKTVVITVNADEAFEGTESFKLRLTNATTPQAPAVEATGTIFDADVPVLSVAASEITEGTGGTRTLDFTVTLSPGSEGSVTVQYQTVGGTAVEGTDYTATSGSLTFAPGETTKTVSVPIATDAIDESAESFTLVLSQPTNATIATEGGTATGTINDDDEPPTVTIASPAAIVEGTGGTQQLKFKVTLSEVSSFPVTIHYSTAAGSAVAEDGDYTPIANGTLTIPAGAQEGEIVIDILGDSENEPTENFTVTIADPENATLGTAVTATGTIIDDDVEISILPPAAPVLEGDGTATLTFTVKLSQTSQQTISVKYATVAGTATHDVDYVGATGTLIFNPGDEEKTVTITIKADALDEADAETFKVVLSEPTGATLAANASEATGTIADDDPTPTVTIASPAAIVEGDSGTKTLSFTVTLSAASSFPVTVKYATVDGTATAEDGDYTPVTDGTVTIPAGQTTATIAIQILGDTDIEGNETFTVELSEPENATLGETDTATGTINDDDVLISIAAGDPVTESATGTTTLIYTVTLSGPSSLPVTVNYATGGGTATSGADYTPASGTLTFEPGQTSKQILVTVADDLLNEAPETVTVTLSSPTNGRLQTGQGVATAAILDNDPLPKVSIGAPAAISEGNGTKTLNFPVTLNAVSGQAVTIHYATTAGTATAGSDFTGVTDATLTIPAGQTTGNIAITILGDTVPESTETFTVTISSPTNAEIETATATGTITDDDAMLTISDATLVEGNDGLQQMVFTISLSSAQGSDVTVRVSSRDGTALANSDYRLTSNVLVTIPAGQTSATISIDIGGDLAPEADETFTLELSNPTNATLGEKKVGTGTIVNDDPLVSISGYAYIDHDNNGSKDAGEKALAGVLVRLTGTDILGNAVDLTQLTGTDGSYNFQQLNPGQYRVVETQPQGLLDGRDTSFDGSAARVNDQLTLVLGAESRANNNFGERGPHPDVVTKRMFFAVNKTTIPTTPPSFAVTGGTSAINIANAATTTVSGTGTPGAHVAVVANDGTHTSIGYTTTVAADGTWSIAGIDVSKLKDGTITYQLAASDNYGNAVLASRTATKTTVAITTVVDPVNASNVADVSVSGTGQVGAAIKVVVSDNAATPHTVEKTTTVAADGTWSVTGLNLTTLNNGVIQFAATATDAAENSVTTIRKVTKGTN
ncbi:MAG: hypothetical protein JNG90_02410 [Planctomycetaceae bacterium]|nr:hypothetical protein [Planctomycetaceae bacterium]